METTVVELPYGNYKILQEKKGQSVSSDTAFFIETINNDTDLSIANVLDIGSGNGIISIMLALTNPEWNFTCIEIQRELAELCIKNTELLSSRFCTVCENLKDFRIDRKFDVIVTNPPFYKKGTGRLSPSESRNISRFELYSTMEDVIQCIKQNLSATGKAFVMYPDLRDVEFRELCDKEMLKIISGKEFPMTNNRKQIIYKIVKI